jgi:hypothetical protein
MKEKIKKIKKTLAILKVVAIVITVLAMLHLSYVFNIKYLELKSVYIEKFSNELHDKYFEEFDAYYVDYDEEIYYYDIAKTEHIKDDVEKIVDFYMTRKDELGFTEELREYYINDKNKFDSKIKERREKFKVDIIENRIKHSAKIAIEKEQHRLDSLWEIQSQKFEIARDEKVARENIVSHFPFAYILGAIMGSSIIPLFFWLLWLIFKMKLGKLLDLDKHRKIELIKNHPNYANDYNSKYKSLSDLEKSKILNQMQFIEKHNNLIQEYYLPILEEQRVIEKNKLELKLKTALELGNITQDEFDKKIGYSRSSKYKKNL